MAVVQTAMLAGTRIPALALSSQGGVGTKSRSTMIGLGNGSVSESLKCQSDMERKTISYTD